MMAGVVPASDLPSRAVPTSDLPGGSDTTKSRDVGPFPGSLTSLENIPHDIAGEFSKGAETIRQSVPKSGDDLGNPVGTALGGFQELFSPITGTMKALADPIRKQIPGKAGEFIAQTGEDAGSLAGPGIVSKSLGALSKVMPGYSTAVKALMNEGVKLTPGQIAQGMFRHAEDAMKSFPVVGDLISGAQARSIVDFNRAVLNKTLSRYGEKVPDNIAMGRDAIDYVGSKLSQKYDALLPKLQWKADQQLASDVAAVGNQSRTMAAEQRKQLGEIIKDVSNRLRINGGATAHTYKEVESELNFFGRTYGRADDPDKQRLGDAIDQLNAALKGSLERANPRFRGQLQDLNSSWAMFKRAEGASVRRVSSGGIFTPADLLSDIKKSTSQGIFARGDGLMQEFADAGQKILPSTLPDSGTARRIFFGELAKAAVVGGTGQYFGIPLPETAAVGAVMSAPYTKPGIAIANKAAKNIPQVFSQANRALPSLGPAAAVSSQLGANQQ